MNYLAHLYLADRDRESIVGSVLGDFVRGTHVGDYPKAIRAAIRMHVRIDVFTDDHPIVAASKARMKPPYRRYGGVLLDIFFDHFLASNWKRYSPQVSLEDFSQASYAALLESYDTLPIRLRRMLPAMVEEDWLASYREVEMIDLTLKRLSRRLKRENPLPHAVSVLHGDYAELQSDFRRFFPELAEFVKVERNQNGAFQGRTHLPDGTFFRSR